MSEDRPATYGEVLRNREFRNLYFAQLFSSAGDQIAKVALALLVYGRTESKVLATLAYAASYLPWVVGGPILSPLADRLQRRKVMVACDLARAVLIGLMALPGVPLWLLFALLLTASLFSAPFDAARAATLPDILEGDQYVVGSSLMNVTSQLVQVAGLGASGVIVGVVGARGALGLDALTFAVSAVLVRFGIRARPAAVAAGRPTLLQDTVEGARIVFGSRVLRSILLLAWIGAAFAIVPEGLAVAYAASVGAGSVAVGVLTAASPAGTVIGAIVIGRTVRPTRRLRLMLPLAALAMLPLLGTVAKPPVWGACLLWAASGFGMAYQLPANAAFVAALPAAARGRAFGLAQAGLQLFQGTAIALGGLLTRWLDVGYVVALAGLSGLAGIVALAARWPYGELRVPVTLPAPLDGTGVVDEQVAASWTGPYLLRPAPREVVVRLVPMDDN